MMPGMNPRQMQKAMQRMGVQQVEIDAENVVINCSDKRIIIDNPSVSKVKMMGQESWQISGDVREEELDSTPEISDEDIKTVMEQANVSEEKAKEALEETKGDIAQAIVNLSE